MKKTIFDFSRFTGMVQMQLWKLMLLCVAVIFLCAGIFGIADHYAKSKSSLVGSSVIIVIGIICYFISIFKVKQINNDKPEVKTKDEVDAQK